MQILLSILTTILARIAPDLIDGIVTLIRDWIATGLAGGDVPKVIRQIVAQINREWPDLSDDARWDLAVQAVDKHLAALGRRISDNLRNRLIEMELGAAKRGVR